ncbi:MAG: porin, partial [Waddliaceae bacterium]
MRTLKQFLWAVTVFLFSSVTLCGEDGDVSKLREEIEFLNQRLSDLEAQMDAREVTPLPEYNKDGEEPLKTVYDEGYFFLGHDHVLKINGYAQVDYRHLFENHPGIDQFLIRRARLDIQGTLEQVWGYRLYMSFGGAASARLQDAWLEYKKWDWFRIRAGQFKEPFSLEALTSSAWIRFV